jgi:hypothetical protein
MRNRLGTPVSTYSSAMVQFLVHASITQGVMEAIQAPRVATYSQVHVPASV